MHVLDNIINENIDPRNFKIKYILEKFLRIQVWQETSILANSMALMSPIHARSYFAFKQVLDTLRKFSTMIV